MSTAPLGAVAGGRQRRSAVRYTNLEKATSSPILTKPNRMVVFDPSLLTPEIVGVVGGMQGWRKTMEDRHALLPLPCPHGALIAVFDGHRGTDAAQFASEAVPPALAELILESGVEALGDVDSVHRKFLEVDASLRRSWEDRSTRTSRANSEANNSNIDGVSQVASGEFVRSTPTSGQSSPQEFNVSTLRAPPSIGAAADGVSSITGTTAIVAVTTEHAYYFLNVGDSRSYLIKRRALLAAEIQCPDGDANAIKENLEQSTTSGDSANSSTSSLPDATATDAKPGLPAGLETLSTSTDHRTTLASELARIESVGGSVINGRVNGKLSVTRALGDFDLKPNLLDASLNPVCCLPDIVKVSRLPEPEAHVPQRNPSGRRGTAQFAAVPGDSAVDAPACVFEYDCLVVGCDGVWELQSIESIARILDERMQSLAAQLTSSNPTDEDLYVLRMDAALKDVTADVLGHCCAGTCDQNGTTLGADNMSLGFLMMRLR